MSVTVKNEINKAEVLASGLKKHLDEVKQIGINAEEIKKMEELSQTLLQKDEEVEALRREANEKGRENRELLAELKEQMFTFRKAVKQRYMQPDWIKYGVQDKR